MGSSAQQILYPSLPAAKDLQNEMQVSDQQFADTLMEQFKFYKNLKQVEKLNDFLALRCFEDILGQKCVVFGSKLSNGDKRKIASSIRKYDYIMSVVADSPLWAAQQQFKQEIDEIM